MNVSKAAQPLTLRDWLRHAEQRLRSGRLRFAHGTHTAGDEAAWLLVYVLHLPHERLERSLLRELTPAERRMASRLIEQRVRTREPLAYLLREAWLGEHRFYVDERVIVPRSFIAELLRERLHPWIRHPARVRRALDMCTGSGCLAVLLALSFPHAAVDAADISPGALAVARRNLRAYRLGRRVQLLRSDLFADLPPSQYDLIVANPPYVDAKAMAALPQEHRHEPRLALAGGVDGLRHMRAILRDAGRFLRPRGLLVVEIGHNRDALERAFRGVPFTWLQTSAGGDFVFLLARQDLPQ
jgi:ribosomal protein L3 glutamine methyltransferase